MVLSSFAAQIEEFLMELQATENSTRELLQHAQSYDLEGVLATTVALAQFMRTDCYRDWGLLEHSNYS